MPWIDIANGESGLSVRNKLNTIGASVGATSHDPHISGNWYIPQGMHTVGVSSAGNVDLVTLCPFVLDRAVTISDLGLRITTGVAVTGLAQAAIYAHNAATGRPTGVALAATGDLAATAAGVVTGDIIGANVTLQPGKYWMAGNNNDTLIAWVTPIININSNVGEMIGSATAANVLPGNNAQLLGVKATQVFGTWPDLTSASFTEMIAGVGNCPPIVIFKVV